MWTTKIKPCRHRGEMKKSVMGWGQIIVSHEFKRGFDFRSNSIDYLLAPIFETGFFLGVFVFLPCAGFPFYFAEESCALASALAVPFQRVVLGLDEAFF